MSRRLLAACFAAAISAIVVVSTATAAPLSGAYLCYSRFQVDPGVWPFALAGTNHNSAATLMVAGYWSPYAEKSVPTRTKIAGGWFLECNLHGTQQTVGGVLVGQRGQVFVSNAKLLARPRPGYYPEST